MRLVAALLAMEVLLPIAAHIGRRSGAVLGAEALGARPRLQELAIHRKMLARQQCLNLRLCQHAGHELRRYIAHQKPVAVLTERRRISLRVVDAKADKPTKQQVKLDQLHQLPLGADRIERLQLQCPQPALRRN